ncbi:mitochondrial fission ELM1 family protein [Nitrincola tibetensis]|nr:mitochondrial fission ELM1 family protein [Nitrincola tibetensis]
MAVISIVNDGKPGHLNQSMGLAAAMQRTRPDLQLAVISPLSFRENLQAWLFKHYSRSEALQDTPSVLIGAGHRTHLTLLALKSYFHIPAIVLMTPSLPLSWFDLCLIPEHDTPQSKPNILVTQGALNRMQPSTKLTATGMLLIGGPSKHHGWDEALILAQIQTLVSDSTIEWVLTSSRRTPATTELALKALYGDRFKSCHDVSADWLPSLLSATQVCWVTEDSVSMVYEALTAGCAVGTLSVPKKTENRLTLGLQKLEEKGIITPFEQWSGGDLPLPSVQFNEAERCANMILSRGWI